MASLYPPILASNQITQKENESVYTLFFTMPGFNSKEAIKAGHVELSIRFKDTNNGAILDKYSPYHNSVYFFDGDSKMSINDDGTVNNGPKADIEENVAEDRTWKLRFSREILKKKSDENIDEHIAVGRELSIQLRFGDNKIDTEQTFANWYNAQVNEQAIGEWSNSIAMYLYGDNQTVCTDYTLVYRNFIPEGKLGYCSNENDPPVRIVMGYTYQAPNGESTYTKSEEILVEPKQTNADELFSKEKDTTTKFNSGYKYYWVVPWKLNIFPNQAIHNTIKMTFEGITEKGVHFGASTAPSDAVKIFTDPNWEIKASSNFSGYGNIQNAFDGNINTIWHTNYTVVDGNIVSQDNPPFTIDVKFGKELTVAGWRYTPRNGNGAGIIQEYNIYSSSDGKKFDKIYSGTFDIDSSFNATRPPVNAFWGEKKMKMIRIEITRSVGNFGSAAEIEFYSKGPGSAFSGVNQLRYTDYLSKFVSGPYYLQPFNSADTPSKEDCLQVQVVTGEEIDDGVIVKLIKNTNNVLYGRSFNIYRVNVDTGEAVTLKTGLQFKSGEDSILVRDYVVEHGEKFEYVVIDFQKIGDRFAGRSLVPTPLLDPLGYSYSFDSAAGRLTDMQYSFLTSRDHQLRLSGNVTLNNISWKTQDALQTTIGAKFPFYTRNAYTKYRTFQLGAVVSIQLDPTSTFLELTPVEYPDGADSKKGGEYWWKTGYDTSKENNFATVEKVLDSDDIIVAQDVQMDKERFGYEQSPKIRDLNKMRWVLKGAKDEQGNPNPSLDSIKYEDAQFGALTAYDGDSQGDPRLHLVNSREYTSERTPDMVFLERKYREKAMEWLIDGVPKLFRSPTEGNMIVVLSNISFTPLQHTDRMVYSFSATATEVAEYNLDNLIEYNLVPVMFESNPEDLQNNSPWGFTPGAEDYDLIKVWEKNGNNPDSWNPRRAGGGADGNFSKKLFNR